ncbi:hypothetical protein ACHQM5_029311 [Ranunculus cassubicifolius]
MFKSFWGSQEQQQPQPHIQENSSQSSWYPPPVVGSTNSSRPSTPGSSTSSSAYNAFSQHGQVSPSEAAGIIYHLKDKSVDDLRKLLSDKDAYNHFMLSLDQVKTQNNVRDELRKETLQLAGENLEKEPRIVELRNQCRIIRTTELAAALEKLNELQRQKDDVMKFYSPSTHLQRLQESMARIEEESDELSNQLLEKEIDPQSFGLKQKKLRMEYHKQALIHLAAKTSS